MILSFNKIFPPEVLAFVSDASVDFALDKCLNGFDPEQAAFLKSAPGCSPQKVVNIKQVHGTTILCPEDGVPPFSEADGSITKEKHVPIAVRTADCLSVFLFDPMTPAIGLVHAGWKGSRDGIAAKAVVLMQKKWGTRSPDVKVALGPCIRPCCYEVGKEFKAHFPKYVTERDGRLYLDLPKVNTDQLVDLGVRRENIFDSERCTCCDEKFFSYRRQGDKAGRMISVMMLRP